MSELTKAVDQVREARWESWRRMAEQLPDHHVLAVEMFRVERNVTVAVFTLVKHGKVVQQVLRGDGRGLNVRPVVPREEHCGLLDLGRSLHVEALLLRDAMLGGDGSDGGDGGPEAYAIAVGDPPPKQPPDPGIVAVGGVGMQNTFDAAEAVIHG